MLASPLRYPGGKAKLFPFLSSLIEKNGIFEYNYYEPYAGGAGLALKLLSTGFVSSIVLNDIDIAIFSFWKSILTETENFCRMVSDTPVTIEEWHTQREIFRAEDGSDQLKLGFATYFLNRTNRSGIIDGAGPIGGYAQAGDWKIDVRLIKKNQIDNIQRVARHAEQIKIYNMDAIDFTATAFLDHTGLVYLDPPYYVKGRKLYKNFYKHDDHTTIASHLDSNREKRWIISYDNVDPIRDLYAGFVPTTYSLNYSAGTKTIGTEVIYLSDALDNPRISGFQVAA